MLRRVLVFIPAALLLVLGVYMLPASATKPPVHKAWVCKYVGKPGVDERLKGGKNPIDVDVAATVGTFFKDGQNRSFVLALDVGQPAPSASDCPGQEVTTTTTEPQCQEACDTTTTVATVTTVKPPTIPTIPKVPHVPTPHPVAPTPHHAAIPAPHSTVVTPVPAIGKVPAGLTTMPHTGGTTVPLAVGGSILVALGVLLKRIGRRSLVA